MSTFYEIRYKTTKCYKKKKKNINILNKISHILTKIA